MTIISASRRTDIPTYYSEWFCNRIKAGYVLVRNPMNIHQISKINLSSDVVDGIVFWTKNPVPMMNRLNELSDYNYYFQFTLNAYGTDVEPNIPSKSKVIIPAFIKLSETVGKDKVVWRYDPILFNDKYTMEYHSKYFKLLASKLSGYTEKCTVSFVDLYRNTSRNVRPLDLQSDTVVKQKELMQRFSKIADDYGIYIDTCAEKEDFSEFNVGQSHCIDKDRLERICQCKLLVDKDVNQRPECGCYASIDIGGYNTCNNGCLYCYANYSRNTVIKNIGKHDPKSPLLFGVVEDDDVIKERKCVSCKDYQVDMFKL